MKIKSYFSSEMIKSKNEVCVTHFISDVSILGIIVVLVSLTVKRGLEIYQQKFTKL